METKVLQKVRKRIARQEQQHYKSKFNFGNKSNGFITSTYNPKAHSYNSLDRRIDAERNANFDKMLEDYKNYNYSRNRKRKIRKKEEPKLLEFYNFINKLFPTTKSIINE